MCWRHGLRKKDKVSHRVTENTEKEGKKKERGQKRDLTQSSPRMSTEDTEMKAN